MSFFSGLTQKGDDGYSTLGKLWRGLATNATGGAIDFMGISQHNRDLKATGNNANLSGLFSALGSGLMAGQQQFLGYTQQPGQNPSFTESVQQGGINYYLRAYLPWVILGVAGIVLTVVLLIKKKR